MKCDVSMAEDIIHDDDNDEGDYSIVACTRQVNCMAQHDNIYSNAKSIV